MTTLRQFSFRIVDFLSMCTRIYLLALDPTHWFDVAGGDRYLQM